MIKAWFWRTWLGELIIENRRAAKIHRDLERLADAVGEFEAWNTHKYTVKEMAEALCRLAAIGGVDTLNKYLAASTTCDCAEPDTYYVRLGEGVHLLHCKKCGKVHAGSSAKPGYKHEHGTRRPDWWPDDVDDEGYPPETRRAMALGVYVAVRCDRCEDGMLLMHDTENIWYCECGQSKTLDEIGILLLKYEMERKQREYDLTHGLYDE